MPELTVHSSGAHGGAIGRRIHELFSDLQHYFFAGESGPQSLRYVIEMNSRFFVLQFKGQQPGFIGLESQAALEDYLAKPQPDYVPVVFDRYALLEDLPLRAVCQFSQPDKVQLLYRTQGGQVRFWLLDERGSIFSWWRPSASSHYLFGPLIKFYDNILERRQLQQSIPELDGGGARLLLYELVMRDGRWQIERRPLLGEDAFLDRLDVQAVGAQDSDGVLRFDLFCGDRQFSVLEYGDQLMPAVADYIRSRRQPGEVYPVYLTDLHLPHDLNPEGYQDDLQTSQYFHCRHRLEMALNAAVQGAPD